MIRRITKMQKKIVGIGKFVFSVFISFLIWDFVTWFIGIFALGLINKINNDILSLIGVFTIWILKSFIIITLTYMSNRNKRVAKYQLEKAKIICLIIFYVLIIGFNISEITNGIIATPTIWSIVTIFHIFLIAFINEIMYKRWIYNEKK